MYLLVALLLGINGLAIAQDRTSLGFSTPNSSSLYAIPFKAEDLRAGERYSTGNHAPGIQAKGEDFGAKRYLGNNKWTHLKSGKDGKKNADFLIYNKPFYAMADGEVCGCWRNAPENPTPGQRHQALNNRLMAGGGNHIWILQDNGVYALYAHAVRGTIPAAICPNNAALFSSRTSGSRSPDIDPNVFIPKGSRPRVKKGQFLGKIGNSGSSSAPHLHVHMEKSGKPISMKFERGLTAPMSSTTSGRINNWTKIKGKEFPSGRILIWPPRSLSGEYTRHKFKASDFQRMFTHLADSGFEPKWIDGYSVANKGFLNFSWKPSNGRRWKAHFGLTARAYQNAFDNRGNLSPIFVDSYTISGQVRYNVIFKQVSGSFLARHGRTYNQHKDIMTEAGRRDLEPINISVVSTGGQRRYTVLYRNKNYNGHYIKSQVKEADYQKLYDDYKKRGFSPVYINAYKHSGEVFFTTIFARNGGGSLRAAHSRSASSIQQEFNSAMQAGYSTKMITAFDGASSQHRFAALWRK